MTLHNVYIGHLKNEITINDLHDLFKNCGQIADLHINPPSDNFQYTYGFVRFDNRDSAERAIQDLDGWPVKGVPIRVQHGKSQTTTRQNTSIQRRNNDKKYDTIDDQLLLRRTLRECDKFKSRLTDSDDIDIERRLSLLLEGAKKQENGLLGPYSDEGQILINDLDYFDQYGHTNKPEQNTTRAPLSPGAKLPQGLTASTDIPLRSGGLNTTSPRRDGTIKQKLYSPPTGNKQQEVTRRNGSSPNSRTSFQSNIRHSESFSDSSLPTSPMNNNPHELIHAIKELKNVLEKSREVNPLTESVSLEKLNGLQKVSTSMQQNYQSMLKVNTQPLPGHLPAYPQRLPFSYRPQGLLATPNVIPVKDIPLTCNITPVYQQGLLATPILPQNHYMHLGSVNNHNNVASFHNLMQTSYYGGAPFPALGLHNPQIINGNYGHRPEEHSYMRSYSNNTNDLTFQKTTYRANTSIQTVQSSGKLSNEADRVADQNDLPIHSNGLAMKGVQPNHIYGSTSVGRGQMLEALIDHPPHLDPDIMKVLVGRGRGLR